MSALDADVERLLDEARQLVRAESVGVAAVVPQIDERMVELARRMIKCDGKVLVGGVGTSGETARRMAHLLSVTRTPALFIHPADSLHGGLGAVSAADVVIAISKGGRSAEVNEFARRSRQTGAYVVGITGDPAAGLARASSVVITLDIDPDAEPGGIVAMGSTLVVSAWGDALAFLTMRLRGEDWGEVLSRHPGGAVGQRGSEQRDPST
jgi:arabinose-5-phosphate isomerase